MDINLHPLDELVSLLYVAIWWVHEDTMLLKYSHL